jgi:hypothetical protein
LYGAKLNIINKEGLRLRMKLITRSTATLSLILSLALGFGSFSAMTAHAVVDNITKSSCQGLIIATGGTSLDTDKNGTIEDKEYEAGKSQCGDTDDTNSSNFGNIIKKVINILSILVGAVSVIMLIVGGFRYVISNGDANSTKGAKDTILYALIGLIIVLFAQVIVRFVWTNASKTTAAPPAPFLSTPSSSV